MEGLKAREREKIFREGGGGQGWFGGGVFWKVGGCLEGPVGKLERDGYMDFWETWRLALWRWLGGVAEVESVAKENMGRITREVLRGTCEVKIHVGKGRVGWLFLGKKTVSRLGGFGGMVRERERNWEWGMLGFFLLLSRSGLCLSTFCCADLRYH